MVATAQKVASNLSSRPQCKSNPYMRFRPATPMKPWCLEGRDFLPGCASLAQKAVRHVLAIVGQPSETVKRNVSITLIDNCYQ